MIVKMSFRKPKSWVIRPLRKKVSLTGYGNLWPYIPLWFCSTLYFLLGAGRDCRGITTPNITSSFVSDHGSHLEKKWDKNRLIIGIAPYEGQYEAQVFQHKHSVYVGEPSTDLDAAWHKLLRSEFPSKAKLVSLFWNRNQTRISGLQNWKWAKFLVGKKKQFPCQTVATLLRQTCITTCIVWYVSAHEFSKH